MRLITLLSIKGNTFIVKILLIRKLIARKKKPRAEIILNLFLNTLFIITYLNFDLYVFFIKKHLTSC